MGKKRSTSDADLEPCAPRRRSHRLANRQNAMLHAVDTNDLTPGTPKPDIEPDVSKDSINDASTYRSLNKDGKEIRILSLEPGRWDDPISCRLSTFSLAGSHPPYETLSYVWDGEPGFGEIILDSRPHRVTKNLFLALRRLRRAADLDRILWVDALCIDQNSGSEKSHQVGLMGEIYKSCERVYIWLGEYLSSKGGALNTRTISEVNFPWIDGKSIVDEATSCDPTYKAFEIIHRLAKDNTHWKDLSHDVLLEFVHVLTLIASSPWWTRLWVIQEVVLPPEAVVLYGCLSTRWDIFEEFSLKTSIHLNECCYETWMSLHTNERTTITSLGEKIYSLGTTRSQDISASNFHELLWIYRTRKASDARDKIYGLLGLCIDPTDDLRPDYSLSAQDVYQRATLFCLKTGKLDILYGQTAHGGSMPSWIHDWSTPVYDKETWVWEQRRFTFRRNNVYRSSLYERARIELLGKSQLSVTGVFVDRVLEVGSCLQALDFNSRYSVYHEWSEFCKLHHTQISSVSSNDSNKEYIQGGNWLDCLHHTLSEYLDFGQQAPQNTSEMFMKWWSVAESKQWNRTKEDLELLRFDGLIKLVTVGRTIFVTESGYIGLGNPEVGDEIWVLLGGDMPFVLRPGSESSSHFLIGDCFVHGIMHGEALSDLENKQRTVVLS